MQKFHQVKSYISYYLKACGAYSLHSPFLFEIYTDIINQKKEYYCFSEIEGIRKNLLKSNKVIEVEDLGRGSGVTKKKQRMVRDIACNSLSGKKSSQLLFKLIDHFKLVNIVELGTSFGINTLYMAKASANARVCTMEGCPQTGQIAQDIFELANVANIDFVQGDINYRLQEVINNTPTVDLVYFDANHAFEPTLRYFNTCLPKKNENSIFVFDDIHWSEEMEQAWIEIKKSPDVTITLDLFDMGIVFFRTNFRKQDYILEF